MRDTYTTPTFPWPALTSPAERLAPMYDDAGFLTLSIVFGAVIAGVLALLLHAAVVDGRIARIHSESSRYRRR